MSDQLRVWLQENTEQLCQGILYRAPNMLPDEEDIAGYLRLLVDSIGEAREKQLTAVQNWALQNVGQDPLAAHDWQVIIRVLKQELSQGLGNHFEINEALQYWWELDNILTSSIIEATQLTSDTGRAELLAHMAQMRERMDRFEQSKTNFITIAAHELRTPLTILEGYTNMLRVETTDHSPLRTYINGLQNGLIRMNEIIGDMIDVSLINLQSFELKYQVVNLEKHIRIIVDQLRRYYEARSVGLTVEPFNDAYLTFADPTLLAKAYNKVLMNALKYTPDGGNVTVRCVPTRQNEAYGDITGYVDIQVKDTGIGIAPHNLTRIFDTFSSVADASLHSSGKTKFKGGGPGLGLAITKGIVEAHGGHIWVESDGHDEVTLPGSLFHLELPIYSKQPESIE